MVEEAQSATEAVMALLGENERSLVDALDEPALVVEGSIVRVANSAARNLLGSSIEGRDVRLAIRHPQALEMILAHRAGEIDATGIVEPGRSWRLLIRRLWPNAALVRMVDRSDAVSAEKMRVDFVANASHELRTPLSTVLGYAETLAEENDLPPDLRANFGRTIRDEARRMLRIIEDLMSLSRIEADRFVAPGEKVDIADAVNSAVANAAHLRNGSSCEFDVRIPADLPPVRGDRSQLVQLLDNLISNAVRYGCDRSDSRVEISAVRNGGWLLLSVTDHGPGIPRDHLPRVTERFYRVDAARSRESGGTGLGLAIVKHIIERHRGALDIRSTVGVGTSVTVRLPLAG
jgi:two-component system phosphate regulon sensor histidine kinase PhoR